MKLIVGLGNPGRGYKSTRHNIGFVVLDALADALGADLTREKYRAYYAQAMRGTEKVHLLKPLTYMNKSGESAALAARNLVDEPSDVLIVYDDVDLPLGRMRFRPSGSPGSHNGMKSIVERLGSREIPRLRIGVGQAKQASDLSDHVLGKFTPDERTDIDRVVERAVQGVMQYIEQGIEAAMNEFNQKD